ncbi:MAG: c-type cytochrome [Armatimonadota bacterium]
MRRYGAIVATMLFVVAGAAALSAASAPPVADVAEPAPTVLAATEQTDRGKELFGMNCARCHGEQGEGTADGPRLIGAPNGIPTYMTAKALFDFVSTEMPNDVRGSLMPQVYWDVLAFILESNRLLPPDVTLGPENAANIRLSP